MQLIHGWRGAKYVGQDKIGNKYFENNNLDFGRHRCALMPRFSKSVK